MDINLMAILPPLAKLLLGMTCGLLLATIVEALGWTEWLARLASPLARLAHLNQAAASAFALAFISPSAANATLSEEYSSHKMSFRELMLGNLFNGLPSYISHTPTILLLLWPVLGLTTLIYVGITLAAAVTRTGFTIILARYLLKSHPDFLPGSDVPKKPLSITNALGKGWLRFKKRLPKLLYFTVPVYLLMYAGQQSGFFQSIEIWMSSHLAWLTLLKPQAMGIILMQLLAEMGATIGAASAALNDGSLSVHDVVIAMLIGNVISTPLRAIRHQLPAYAGFYSPGIAFQLIIANQSLRAASLILMIIGYVLII